MWLPISPILDLWFHMDFIALIATVSNIGSPKYSCDRTFIYDMSPVKRLREPNSTINVVIPAVQVIGVSPTGTPVWKFTVPYGIPVVVLKAGSNFLANASLSLNKGPVQGHPGSTSNPALLESRWALKSPPTTR